MTKRYERQPPLKDLEGWRVKGPSSDDSLRALHALGFSFDLIDLTCALRFWGADGISGSGDGNRCGRLQHCNDPRPPKGRVKSDAAQEEFRHLPHSDRGPAPGTDASAGTTASRRHTRVTSELYSYGKYKS
jgi:hypothetical protein